MKDRVFLKYSEISFNSKIFRTVDLKIYIFMSHLFANKNFFPLKVVNSICHKGLNFLTKFRTTKSLNITSLLLLPMTHIPCT